jgi:DNA polymerase
MARKGFFNKSQVASKKYDTKTKSPRCGRCKLYETCKSPKMPPTGRGEQKVLYVGEAPGRKEDLRNEQFVGESGSILRRLLRKNGADLDAGIKTNSLICRPPDNEKPTKKQITACRPNLQQTIQQFQPHVIIPMGEMALKALISHKFQKDIGGIGRWRGSMIPDREYKCWICPTFHPSYVSRDETPESAEPIFKEDLRHALRLLDVPLPDYVYEDEEDKIEIIKHPKEITQWLKKLVHMEDVRLTAYDYESTGLKPQHPDQRIRTCSISCGPNHAVAFPIVQSKDFEQAFVRYLSSFEIKKIAANMKFERDWSQVKFGAMVNGLFLDTMLASHVLDNRPKINGLEFIAYAYFGVEPYDSEVRKYLKTDNDRGNELNRIFEADLRSLLIYNGMDSMLEFRAALVQMERLGIDYSHLYSGPTGRELAPQYPYDELRRKMHGTGSKGAQRKSKTKKKDKKEIRKNDRKVRSKAA